MNTDLLEASSHILNYILVVTVTLKLPYHGYAILQNFFFLVACLIMFWACSDKIVCPLRQFTIKKSRYGVGNSHSYSFIAFHHALLVHDIKRLGHERMSYYSNVRSNIECSNGNLDIQIKNN